MNLADHSNIIYLLQLLVFLAKNWDLSIVLESYSSKLNMIRVFYFDI